MRNQLVQEALKTVGSSQILVNIVSKRVRQLGQGMQPLVPVNARWTFMDIALREAADSKITIEMLSLEKPAAKAA